MSSTSSINYMFPYSSIATIQILSGSDHHYKTASYTSKNRKGIGEWHSRHRARNQPDMLRVRYVFLLTLDAYQCSKRENCS